MVEPESAAASVVASRAGAAARPSGRPPRTGDSASRILAVSPGAVIFFTAVGVCCYAAGSLGAATLMRPLLSGEVSHFRTIAIVGIVLMTLPFTLLSVRFLVPSVSRRVAVACSVAALGLLAFMWGLWVAGESAATGYGSYIQHQYGNLTTLLALAQFAITLLSSLALALVYSPGLIHRSRLTLAILCSALYGSAVMCYAYISFTL